MTTTHASSRPENPTHPFNQFLGWRVALNWETLVFIAILLLAIFTRFYILGDRVMSHDESLHTRFSYDLYRQGIYNHTPLMHGPILFHVTAFMYALFGDNDFTSRIYPALMGVLTVMFPLLFRRWLGRWGAILTSIMLLISPLLLYYDRYIRHDSPAIFAALLMVYAILMYVNGPPNARRKARWLYLLALGMIWLLGSKEVAFIYIAIFGSFLTLYWLIRMAQHFWNVPGKSILYLLSIAGLLGGVAALGMYVVLSVSPIDNATAAGAGSLAAVTLTNWTLVVIMFVVGALVGTLLWVYRTNLARVPWLDALLIVALVVVVVAGLIIVEERSHVIASDASQPAAPAVPGQETTVEQSVSRFTIVPLVATWIVAAVVVFALLYSTAAGWWRTLYRFAEFDILLLMGTLILPWLAAFVVNFTGAQVNDYVAVGNSLPPFLQQVIPATTPEEYGRVALALLAIVPLYAISITAGLVWNWKRWLISAAIFHIIYLFFFTTMFTNMRGLAGMYNSLGYWLEQQGVRRGSQPQYYYLVLIMPFYEFLPVIGSFLAMFSGLGVFWRFRRDRQDEKDARFMKAKREEAEAIGLLTDENTYESDTDYAHDAVEPLFVSRRHTAEWLKHVPFLLFVSWWGVLNLIAYTLAGEKMPWLGTHMTVPLILLTGWYFGRILDRVEPVVFFRRGWIYLLLLPVLYVAFAQIIGPFLVGQGIGGLSQQDLASAYRWYAGVLIATVVVFVLSRLVSQTGWANLRQMAVVAVFAVLAFITFRSAWMASFINYDLATEYLVYAHAAPANKTVVVNWLEDMSRLTTDGMNIRFVYDDRMSWPGSWYFREFPNAVFAGANPSPRLLEDAAAVIVGESNRAAVETALEDRYFLMDESGFMRLWWPMQDYFGLTPERVINTLDFSADNPQAAQVRQGIFDIWWSRDYSTYGSAVNKDFSITNWPVSERMYFYVRKDIAAKVWNLGIGDGAVANPLDAVTLNACSANWQPIPADLVLGTTPGSATGFLNHPLGLSIALDGHIYVPEEFNYRISVFDQDGNFLTVIGQRGVPVPGQVTFERPNSVAIGPDGNLYVADTWNYRVIVVSPDGEYIRSWGQRGEYGIEARTEPFDGFWGPRGIAVDSQGRVFVADTGNKRVRVYTSEGQFLYDIASGGSGVGQLDEPSGLYIGGDSLLYVADTWNQRVSVFTLEGAPVYKYITASGQATNSFAVRGWRDDLGNRPYLAVDSVRDLIYVGDPDAGRVLVYDSAGNCLGSFGQLGSVESLDATQFVTVGGLALDSAGNLYVTDSGGGRVLRFAPFERPAVTGPDSVQPIVIDGVGGETTDELILPLSEGTEELIFPLPEMTQELPPAGESTEEVSAAG
ncbi:MAG: TIGR03663 family protein [Anaerolineaceae bacterium]|nr:TIGR03663 family protein [Anaerolineaceae bacterium]